MSSSPPPITRASSKTAAFAHQAAKASWTSVVIICILGAFGRGVGAPVLIELLSLFLILVGLVFGLVALLGVRKHGAKGILVPAIIGIALNGLLLFIFITNFLAANGR